jgi:hypothetical protein
LLTISRRDCIGILILLHKTTAVQEVFKWKTTFDSSITVGGWKLWRLNRCDLRCKSSRSRYVRKTSCFDEIFVGGNWVDTRWQQYSTHLHTNNTQKNTMRQNTQNGTYLTIRMLKLTKEYTTIRIRNLRN